MAMVKDIDVRGMQHCETTALGVLLRHEGLDLSEPMLFGLGSGLSFIYWDSKAMGFPFLGGRVKPFELTRNLAAALGLELLIGETTSPRKAWRNVAAPIDAGRPVGLQLDSYHLDYFTTKVHFGGHVVAMYGYDEQDAYLVDTAPQGGAVSTSLAGLARARAERGPMTAKHRSFTITAPSSPTPPPDRIIPAIKTCAEAFLNPPIANLGHRGIEKTAKHVPTWLQRSDNPREDLPRTAVLMERAGTGGALFRNLYRDFLAECAQMIDSGHLRTGHTLYTEAATLWTQVAALVATAGESGDAKHLVQAGSLLHELSRVEREAMQALSRL
ncbi:BtrH N-terminal domain-containing protein [Streptomyces sp. Je 1-4]|uniref:BtrH N-terminal domain-containing protein n=1 Tax=Streptomyces TaxID=1883 RepID=UPI00140ED09A|nr:MULTISPECIES: BtrH N-terminal domain-containing protein [unclassified Streptomyces]QIK07518.1 BtrH N-terminal domain-containing protein [Streptomyces sp. ID38640]UYB41092.1 BtrH N-terminal domain-containing protein [Streptomyces sp. Je 1-4]UZQ37259.1 BtrH N-terminal domain-containing protein [Streptomyces sp. Je 1-4] [Streptomyces sp. Je 1-4 4N24]UZQ44676.1 BtrH N-terminal domain-containing protein [Streptomyces sp. Je 1-4] [Streptomyces sp. Je 1-4 4N24_ara]